jgi:hypothetical protein
MSEKDAVDRGPLRPAVTPPMSWLVFARWMVGALLVSFINPYWVTQTDPFFKCIAYFIAACTIGAVLAGVVALFFTPKPFSRIRKTFVIATWSLLCLSLFGNWDTAARKQVLSAWSVWTSSITPKESMTQAELVELAKARDALLDHRTNVFRNDSVTAAPGLVLIYLTTMPDYTANEARALPNWPRVEAALLSGFKEQCAPKLLAADDLQRGVTRRYIFRANDGITLLDISTSKKICESQ